MNLFVEFRKLLSIRLSGLCFLYWCFGGYGLVGVRNAYTWLPFLVPGCFLGWGVYGNGSIGCTNNNYASREKCKKCGQPKELAAMPAIAMPGASLPTYSNYFARVQGGADQKMNIGLTGNGALQQSLPLASSWPVAGADKYGAQPASTWSFGGNPNSGLPYANPTNQLLSVPKGWRNGDWICSCGFHNYSSRAQVW